MRKRDIVAILNFMGTYDERNAAKQAKHQFIWHMAKALRLHNEVNRKDEKP